MVIKNNYKEKNGNKNSSGNRDVCEGCFHPDADFDDMNEKEKRHMKREGAGKEKE